MELLKFEGEQYPQFQAQGNASQFAIPFAKHYCEGAGYDIGCNRIKWSFPNSIPIDLEFDDEYHATNLPDGEVDYIYSSHCLEHVDHWVDTVQYWTTKLKKGGILFLYLPHYSQKYWRPWNNKKHKHIIEPNHIEDLLVSLNYTNISCGGVDLNNAFMIVAEKM